MEPETLPITRLTSEPEKQTPPAASGNGDLQPKTNGFFYIGHNRTTVDFLIRNFDFGFISQNISSAQFILKRLFEKQHIPEIIIIDGVVEETAIVELHGFIMATSRLSLIPIVLDASSLTSDDLEVFRRIQCFDEIILLKDMDKTKLLVKIEFLKKIKLQNWYYAAKHNLPSTTGALMGSRKLTKRVFDVITASVALVVLGPLMGIIAVAIKMESRGRVFYISKRAGQGYRVFDFYKFRTMVEDADKQLDELHHLNQYQGADLAPLFYKFSNDPRVTRLGRFLRKTSLDELPQLMNVLLGDMSMVGNRPLPLYEAASLTTDELAARFMAPVGMTGLWQIRKRGQQSMSVEERLHLDIDYLDKYNFLYDLWIMANTPSAMIQKTNG